MRIARFLGNSRDAHRKPKTSCFHRFVLENGRIWHSQFPARTLAQKSKNPREGPRTFSRPLPGHFPASITGPSQGFLGPKAETSQPVVCQKTSQEIWASKPGPSQGFRGPKTASLATFLGQKNLAKNLATNPGSQKRKPRSFLGLYRPQHGGPP